jgi:hypothetical protein
MKIFLPMPGWVFFIKDESFINTDFVVGEVDGFHQTLRGYEQDYQKLQRNIRIMVPKDKVLKVNESGTYGCRIEDVAGIEDVNKVSPRAQSETAV